MDYIVQNLKYTCLMSLHNSPKSNQRQMSEYEQFRIQRFKDRTDDDNISAHFSNPLSHNTDREEDLVIRTKMYRNNNKQTDRQNQLSIKLAEKQRECNQLARKYNQMLHKYENSEKEALYFKRKYEQKIHRDKQTKQKLEGWIKSAKNDLLEAP